MKNSAANKQTAPARQVQLFKAAHSLLRVDVAGNTLTTTSTQPSTECSYNMVEDGLNGIAPSSCAQSFSHIRFLVTL